MLTTLLILFCTLALALCVCLGWVLIQSRKLFKYAITKVEDAKKEADSIKKRTEEKYNKYAAMSVEELDNVLMLLFASHLETASLTDVAENDPNAAIKLYEKAVEQLTIYLSEDTISAIDYYYGKNYISKWCKLHFQLLENHGVISRIISKDIYAGGIMSVMMNDRIILNGKNWTGA